MSQVIKGSCLCQSVSFTIEPPIQSFQYCHCSRCRKVSGGAHSANLLVKADQLSWSRGADLVGRFELPEAKAFCTGFCTRCGSALPWLTKNGRWAVIPAGTLDDDPEVRPERNIFFASRGCWYQAASELPAFDTVPPRT